MPGAYGKSVPLQQRTAGNLWFGIIWCSAIGALVLAFALPLLFPWRLTFAALLLLGVVVLFEYFALRGVWDCAAELQRRKREARHD